MTNAPTFGHDPRWPFVGTDLLQSITNKVTWVKGAHNFKGGFYYERMARNVAVYQTYNPQGTYYFGVDKASPVDTAYPYSNLLTGAFFAYGEDNKKQINHARYNQVEWFLQDSWKFGRRLTVDYGARFYVVGPLYSIKANLGLFQGSAYDPKKGGQLLFPTMINGQKQAINPTTGAVYPYVRQGTFDTASYTAGGIPFTGLVQYPERFFNTPNVQIGPRAGFAWDCVRRRQNRTSRRFRHLLRPALERRHDRRGHGGHGSAGRSAQPADAADPQLHGVGAGQRHGRVHAADVMTASPDFKPPATYNWSFGVQRDLGRGMIMEVAYVGNVAHRIANSNNLATGTTTGNAFGIDVNAVPPLTTWTPTGCPNQATVGCPVQRFLDPTSSGGNSAYYSTNLIRSMTGYAGYGGIYAYTFIGESYYDALQTSLNKRLSKNLQYGINYTWSKTILYARYQWVPDQLSKNVTARPHAVNYNFGYDFPSLKRWSSSAIAKHFTEGWRLNGNGVMFYGTPMTVACTAVSAPIGYWTGTPTGNLPFRCQMSGNMWLSSGYPSATADPKLQYPFDKSAFTLPGPNSLGIGNTPPTLTYGPGVFNLDLALSKEVSITERVKLELKGESFNVLNHFNPSNPNTTLNLNFSTGANTNAAFGTITSAQLDSRRFILSAKIRF